MRLVLMVAGWQLVELGKCKPSRVMRRAGDQAERQLAAATGRSHRSATIVFVPSLDRGGLAGENNDVTSVIAWREIS